jgi:hypothetical protein
MKTTFFLILAIVSGLMGAAWVAVEDPPTTAPVDDQEGIRVEVCGIKVATPGYKSKDQELKPFAMSDAGTEISFLAYRQAGGLVAFDDRHSQVNALMDDQGRKLRITRSPEKGDFQAFAEQSKDRKAVLFKLQSEDVAGKGAKALRLKGKLLFKCASQKKAFQQEDVALKEGSRLEVGPLVLVIDKVAKPSFIDKPLEVSFKTNQEMSMLAAIRFLDEQGKTVESSRSGFGRWSLNDATEYHVDYTLDKKLDKATIEVTAWIDMKTVEVPLDLAISVGLSSASETGDNAKEAARSSP